jgi:hypothetical protein
MQVREAGSIRDAIMSIEPVHPTPVAPQPPKPAAPVRAADETPKQQPAEAQKKDAPAKGPEPQEVVGAAAEAYEVLRESARTLQFEATETGFRIEVYNANGELVRSIPPNEEMARSAARGTTWQA